MDNNKPQISIKELGHVVLYVTDLEKMIHFYNKILGFRLVGEFAGAAAFSTDRTHHEMLLIEIGGTPVKTHSPKPGLYHIGFKIGDNDDDLRAAIKSLQEHDIPISGAADHTVSHSLYTQDPDGNELELYVDTDVDWKSHPELLFNPPKTLKL